MNASLLAALRVVARADSDPTRTILFDRLAARSRAVRLARWSTHGPLRGRLPAAIVLAAYGLLTSRLAMAPPAAEVWALPLFENDRRAIDELVGFIGVERVGRSAGGSRLARAALRLIGTAVVRGEARRFLRVVGRLCRRHDFLVACRTAGTLACAMAGAGAFPRSRVRALLVSSDYNAEAVGLAHAARGAGRATIYVSHAPTHHLSPPLAFTLAVLDGEAALEGYRRKGPVRARCAFKGVAGRERPLATEALTRPHPALGIFLPKEVDWPALRALVREARAFAPRSILIRWHPNASERPPLDRLVDDLAGVALGATGAALDEDARRCDWVIADRNSSVPLTVLRAGVPAVIVAGLAVFPGEQVDLYGLVADRIVPAPVSLRDLRPESLAAFYGPGWADRFRRHDGAYGRPAEAVARAIREAVDQAVEHGGT